MNNIVHIEDYREASIVAKKWKNIGYRTKGRVAALTAAKHGKIKLRDGTADRLRAEILTDLYWLAESKKSNEGVREADGSSRMAKILRSVAQNGLWRNKQSGESTPYSTKSIQVLLSIPSSESEVNFIREYLQRFMGVRREVIENIISNPSFTQF